MDLLPLLAVFGVPRIEQWIKLQRLAQVLGRALAEHGSLHQAGFYARDHALAVRIREHRGEGPPASRRNLAQENVARPASQIYAGLRIEMHRDIGERARRVVDENALHGGK